jgi:hypothetical protein
MRLVKGLMHFGEGSEISKRLLLLTDFGKNKTGGVENTATFTVKLNQYKGVII